MENKLIYKQISIEEMLGKTVESVVHEFDDIVLIKFTDKTFISYYYDDEEHGLYFKDYKYEDLVKSSTHYSWRKDTLKFDYDAHFLIRCGVLDKDLFEKDVLNCYESDEIKRKEEEELRLFNELREKYENK